MQKTCCDHCGCAVIKNSKKILPGFPTGSNTIVVKEKYWPNPVKEFDLCTDCMSQLREFLDGTAAVKRGGV